MGNSKGGSDGIVLGMAEEGFHLGIQRPFNECLGELLEEAVLAYQVFGFQLTQIREPL